MENTSLVQMVEWLERFEVNFFTSGNLSLVVLKNLRLDIITLPRCLGESVRNLSSEASFTVTVEMRIVNPVSLCLQVLILVIQELLNFFLSEASVQWFEVLAEKERKKCER